MDNNTISLNETIDYIISTAQQQQIKRKQAVMNGPKIKTDLITKQSKTFMIKRVDADLADLELVRRGQHNVIDDRTVLSGILGSVIRFSMSCKIDVVTYEHRVSDRKMSIGAAKHRIAMLDSQLAGVHGKQAEDIKNSLAETKQYVAKTRAELAEYNEKLFDAKQHLANMKKLENSINARITELSVNKIKGN